LAPTPLRLATVLVLITAFSMVVWLSRNYDPTLGEPVVHLKIEPAPVVATMPAAREEPPPDGAIDLFAEESPATGTHPNDVIETETAVVVAPPVRLTPAPARGFFENTPDGPLPKRSGDARRPFDIYSRPAHPAVLQSSQPKIAILLGGMGLNEELTKRALNELPEEITLAFAPYGQSLQKTINNARAQGHEVMLQLPMEPFGYPNQDPGPHTLLVSSTPTATASSLSWLLSRFAGYIGVVNYLGARFTSETTALAPVLQILKDRGLVYLDDGSSARSVAEEVAVGIDLPLRQASLVIDAANDFSSVSAKLQELEKLSRKGRIVIGVGTGFPATINAVENWAKGLRDRGVLLVPVSAAFRAPLG
jgi:polysaccharide deacetylase 2 family uncharacterized protein YibQ